MRMLRYQSLNPSRQKGVAAVWMSLLLVPIMGVTFWAVESTRYVQETSRLRDAAEAAAIAVTIEDQSANARELAIKYVENYVRDIKSTALSTQRFYQAENEDAGVLEYIQYTVNARTTHDSWFASHFIPSFGEQQDLAGSALARKYPVYLGDNNIDIIFVSDFSGSMNYKWGDNQHNKIDDLQTAINQISNKILCTSTREEYVDGEWKNVCDEVEGESTGDKLLNRVGFVPFNIRTREIVANQARATSQLIYKDRYNAYLSPYSYNDVDWEYWRVYKEKQVLSCAVSESDCPSPSAENQEYAERIRDVMEGDSFADVYPYVDLSASVSGMFTDKSALKSNYYSVNSVKLFSGHGDSNSSQFYNIPLTNNLSDLEVISSMWAQGRTAAFQGILRGAQLLYDGNPNSADEEEQQAYNNKIKMLLILSDGQESPNNGLLKGLVNAGMCDEARDKIPGLYIGIIGIDFSASKQSGFQDCVIDSTEDIIDVTDLDELIEKIEELIRKGSKASGITKLY